MTNENTPTPEAKPSVPFFKSKWVWVVGAILIIGAISSAGKGGTKAAVDPAPVSSSSSDTQAQESAAPEEFAAEEEPSETIGQSNARAAADNYISTMPFSTKGLIEQLVFRSTQRLMQPTQRRTSPLTGTSRLLWLPRTT